MLAKMTLEDAVAAAAEEHTWDSTWTRDGEIAQTLDEFWDEAQTPNPPADAIFTYDGARIGRQGPDIQDFKRLIYMADARCSICNRFVDRDADERKRPRTKDDKVAAAFCVNCISGGVIGKVLPR